MPSKSLAVQYKKVKKNLVQILWTSESIWIKSERFADWDSSAERLIWIKRKCGKNQMCKVKIHYSQWLYLPQWRMFFLNYWFLLPSPKSVPF